MDPYKLFFFIFRIFTAEAQVMLPAYQGVQYKGGIAGCGTLTINHLAVNGVAPENKTVTYGHGNRHPRRNYQMLDYQ